MLHSVQCSLCALAWCYVLCTLLLLWIIYISWSEMVNPHLRSISLAWCVSSDLQDCRTIRCSHLRLYTGLYYLNTEACQKLISVFKHHRNQLSDWSLKKKRKEQDKQRRNEWVHKIRYACSSWCFITGTNAEKAPGKWNDMLQPWCVLYYSFKHDSMWSVTAISCEWLNHDQNMLS